MFNPFKRVPADPSKLLHRGLSCLSDKGVSRVYSQKTGDPDVKGIYGFDSVVRLNSTYLELVDRYYNWRGTWTLAGAFFFCMFLGLFFKPLITLLQTGFHSVGIWIVAIIIWSIMLLLSWGASRIMISEVFFSTYYPIRFNRKNRMVYIYQAGGDVLSVPWQDLRFVLTGGKNFTITEWTIIGCVMADDGETITRKFSLPINLTWDPEDLTMCWEFIRCYMEEGDEYLPDLVDTIPWCPPVENQKEGWLFGFLYLSKQFGRLGLLVNAVQFPFFFIISFSRWLVMKTSKVPVWPAEIAAACQPEENDPVNKGAEHNPPQVWRPMYGLQGKTRYAQSFARESEAMNRITARLRAKYGRQESAD